VRAERIDVDEVVGRALDQNRVAARARSIDLVAGKPSAAHVYGDDGLLVAAVDNLISNAIRYSPDGSRVGVGVRAGDDAVEISITDQGEGIPAADLDRVFERFYRVDSARSRHTGGSGLGLAITKHAVENHGGSVRAWSKLGSGSTFTIRLPLAADAADTIDARGVL
jgi:two-component system sensor histidine kinase SenX3